jgi:hypothetical protein
MSTLFLRWSAIAFVIGLPVALLPGCVGGYGYDGGYGYGGGSIAADYYEPYGADYGGWGAGYQVAPLRGGYGHSGSVGGGGRSVSHAYRSAPASHAMPSIPSGSRGGGGPSGPRH